MVEVNFTYNVTDCRDCPFRKNHYGHGECWEECTHKGTGREWHERILWGCQAQFKKVPEWCPLGFGGKQ
jgi:hypothetical protein